MDNVTRNPPVFNSRRHLVGATITHDGDFASHAAIVSREMGFPSEVGTVDGTPGTVDTL